MTTSATDLFHERWKRFDDVLLAENQHVEVCFNDRVYHFPAGPVIAVCAHYASESGFRPLGFRELLDGRALRAVREESRPPPAVYAGEGLFE